MDIKRIDGYDDPRFSRTVLAQHGAFLVDGVPCGVEITGPREAIIRGMPGDVPALVEEFRFFAEHITNFYDEAGQLLHACPPVKVFPVALTDIQPSQFFVDADKLAAVSSFVRGPEDIILPLTAHQGRYVSLDGHTRLALAARSGYAQVYGFLTEPWDSLWGFVAEAQKRGVRTPHDLSVIPHEDYTVKWDQFCDAYFAKLAP